MRQMLLKALASGLIMSLFPFAAISAPAGPSHADSLLRLLSKTHDAVGRERIYVQLADLSGDSLELAAPYWDAALAEARKSGDLYGCKDALDFLVRKFAGRDSQRAEKYIALADSILPGPRHALFRSSLYAYYIWKLMNDNNAVETVKHELDRLKTKIHNELSPEERIEWEFLTGLSLDFSSLATEAYDNIGKAIPYVIDPRRPGDIAECWCDPSKAKRELGWEAQYGIEEMCAHSWNWQSHNPDGYKTAE